MTDAPTFVVFGATGHLSRTKLIPALARVLAAEHITDHALIGVGSRSRSDDSFRSMVEDSLREAGTPPNVTTSFVAAPIRYLAVSDDASYDTLARVVAETEDAAGLPQNRVLYLAIPPSQLDATVMGVQSSGLDNGDGWTRLVVEKPFGTNLATAKRSNEIIHRSFHENQVYRIDHFLGKETVRNLLVFRFTNSLFEQTWNRRHIESVEITVAETAGLDGRAGYFDESGTVRDMVQNHLTQILTLIAMEPPVTMDAPSIHTEKVKVLSAMRQIEPDHAVIGQYTPGVVAGHPVGGYLEEPGVPQRSTTPTFAALRVHIDNWRWHGVPFFLRTGKRMSKRSSIITVRYLRPPICLFHAEGTCSGHQNVLRMRLQPDEGFDLLFDVKQPGDETRIEQIALTVNYDAVRAGAADAYETLLTDVIEGDQTLFVRADEVEAAWERYEPLLDRGDIHPYAAGTDGPEGADRLMLPDEGMWARL
ncbi:MAG: glucose-6-phosphate dehydrogenase [Acidimicrobiia bacterium]